MKLKSPDYQNIKNIIFDYGNVLLDIDINLTVKALQQLGLVTFNPEHIHPNNTDVFLELELGNISTEKFIERLKSFADGKQLSDIEVYYAWNMLLKPFDFRRFELLAKLRQNYNIYLLSNTNLPHREYLAQKFYAENPANRDFESYFDACFYSDAMHLRKPNIEIYQQVLQQAGIKAEQTLFIDDNAPNLDGAKLVGINTYHLVAPESVLDLFSESKVVVNN